MSLPPNGITSRPPAAVVVAVDVEEHEAGVIGGDLVEHACHRRIETTVILERALDNRLVEGAAPRLEPPALLGSPVHGGRRLAVEVDFEARAVGDDVGRNAADRLAGERVLLAQALGVGQGCQGGDLGPQAVAVVDRCGSHRPRAALQRPPQIIRQCSAS